METLDLAKLAAEAANSKKATRINVYDLGKQAPMCDYMVVCSASNEKQTVAIADAIVDAIYGKSKVKPIAVEGKQVGQWILLDYGSCVVHIFFEIVRDFYALEKLWPQARQVKLSQS